MADLLFWIEKHPGLAAWLQAVFSIIAIIAAVLMGWWQTHTVRKQSRIEEERSDVKNAGLCLLAIRSLGEALSDISHVSGTVPLHVHREGSIVRINQCLNLLEKVAITRLKPEQIIICAQIVTQGGNAISILSADVRGDDEMSRLHVKNGIAAIKDQAENSWKVFQE